MLTRAISKSFLWVGGLCGIVYGGMNIKVERGGDDLLFMAIMFLGFYCMLAGLVPERRNDGPSTG